MSEDSIKKCSTPPHKGVFDLPPDYKGGWETDRDKALFDLSLTPEQRLRSLEKMIEFTRMVHGTIHGLR